MTILSVDVYAQKIATATDYNLKKAVEILQEEKVEAKIIGYCRQSQCRTTTPCAIYSKWQNN
jgi:hypothetical protein